MAQCTVAIPASYPLGRDRWRLMPRATASPSAGYPTLAREGHGIFTPWLRQRLPIQHRYRVRIAEATRPWNLVTMGDEARLNRGSPR